MATLGFFAPMLLISINTVTSLLLCLCYSLFSLSVCLCHTHTYTHTLCFLLSEKLELEVIHFFSLMKVIAHTHA